jgi:hypothetical protein
MDELARHLAGWGVPAITVDLCGASLFSGNHDGNAAALRALAHALAPQGVIYAGFSAGALAALLAAPDDPSARALLLLDLVDAGARATAIAPALRLPVFALTAAPSACNARGNGQGALRTMHDARVWQIVGASHCHFEIPLDAACTALCGGSTEPQEIGRMQAVILGLVTAAARSAAGLDDGARHWWLDDGQAARSLLAAGRVTRP